MLKENESFFQYLIQSTQGWEVFTAARAKSANPSEIFYFGREYLNLLPLLVVHPSEHITTLPVSYKRVKWKEGSIKDHLNIVTLNWQ